MVGEGMGTTVPELFDVEDGVEDGGGIDATELLIDAFAGAGAAWVGSAFLKDMAGGTGDGVVFGETRIVVELASEVHLGGVDGKGVGYDLYGLVGVLGGGEACGVVLLALLGYPLLEMALLCCVEACTPVCCLVFEDWHVVVVDGVLKHGEEYFAGVVEVSEVKVEKLGAMLYVGTDYGAYDWEVGVEWLAVLRTVAVIASILLENGEDLL